MKYIKNDGSIQIVMRHNTFTPSYYDTILFDDDTDPLKDFTFRVNITHGSITLSLSIEEYSNEKVRLGAMEGNVFIDSSNSSSITLVFMEYKIPAPLPHMVTRVIMNDDDCMTIRYYNDVTIYAEFRDVEYDISYLSLELVSCCDYNFLEILKASGKMKIIMMDE